MSEFVKSARPLRQMLGRVLGASNAAGREVRGLGHMVEGGPSLFNRMSQGPRGYDLRSSFRNMGIPGGAPDQFEFTGQAMRELSMGPLRNSLSRLRQSVGKALRGSVAQPRGGPLPPAMRPPGGAMPHPAGSPGMAPPPNPFFMQPPPPGVGPVPQQTIRLQAGPMAGPPSPPAPHNPYAGPMPPGGQNPYSMYKGAASAAMAPVAPPNAAMPNIKGIGNAPIAAAAGVGPGFGASSQPPPLESLADTASAQAAPAAPAAPPQPGVAQPPLMKMARAAALKDMFNTGKNVAKTMWTESRAVAPGIKGIPQRAFTAVDTAGRAMVPHAKQFAAANPGTMKALKLGAGATAGAGLYGTGRSQGHAAGMQEGTGLGFDAGLQYGVENTNALNQQDTDFISRLKQLFTGRPSHETASILDSLRGNRTAIVNNILAQSA